MKTSPKSTSPKSTSPKSTSPKSPTKLIDLPPDLIIKIFKNPENTRKIRSITNQFDDILDSGKENGKYLKQYILDHSLHYDNVNPGNNRYLLSLIPSKESKLPSINLHITNFHKGYSNFYINEINSDKMTNLLTATLPLHGKLRNFTWKNGNIDRKLISSVLDNLSKVESSNKSNDKFIKSWNKNLKTKI